MKNRGAKKNRLKFVTRYVPVPEEEFAKIAGEPERMPARLVVQAFLHNTGLMPGPKVPDQPSSAMDGAKRLIGPK